MRLLGRRSDPPGTGSGTRSGGSTRNPSLPKPHKPRRTRPRAEPQHPAPNGPVAVTTPATPPLATFLKSRRKPRPSPVSCTGGSQAPAATWSQPTREGGQLMKPAAAAASPPTKGTWPAPTSGPAGCSATFGLPGNGQAEHCRAGRRRHRPAGGRRVGQRHGLICLCRGGHCVRSHSCSRTGSSGFPDQE